MAQLVAVGGLTAPLVAAVAGWASLGPAQWLGLALLTAGSGAASAALYFYSSRYVGELALLPGSAGGVRISTLDFWGARSDLDVPLASVVPPLEGLSRAALAEAARQTFLPLSVAGHEERQFVLSLRHGVLVDRGALLQLLDGSLARHQQSLKPTKSFWQDGPPPRPQ